MKKLIALLAAAGAVVFFWRKKQQDGDSMWDADREPSGSWEDPAASAPDDSSSEASDIAASED